MPEESTPSRATLRFAVGLLGGEAVVLAGLTVFLLYESLIGAGDGLLTGIGTIVFTALVAALLGWFSWVLGHGRSWPRGPAIVFQLLMVPIGWSMTAGGVPAVGVPVILLGLVGAGTLLAPATRAALEDTKRP